MKDAYEVLRQKEAEFARVRKEVESLNIVIRLLADEDDKPFADVSESRKKPSSSVTASTSQLSGLQTTSADVPLTSRLEWLNALKVAK